MADSATAKKLTRLGASFTRRYGLAFVSVTGALLLELLFHHFHLLHPFTAFALSAIAATFWYASTRPGIVFLLFAVLMIWVRRSRDVLEVEVADRTAGLTAANEEFRKEKAQLDGLFELSPDAVISIGCNWTRS